MMQKKRKIFGMLQSWYPLEKLCHSWGEMTFSCKITFLKFCDS